MDPIGNHGNGEHSKYREVKHPNTNLRGDLAFTGNFECCVYKTTTDKCCSLCLREIKMTGSSFKAVLFSTSQAKWESVLRLSGLLCVYLI